MRRNTLYIFLGFLLFVSCDSDQEKVVEGDLYFNLFDLEGIIGVSDSVLLLIENGVKEIKRDTLNRRDRNVYDAAKFMVENDLLRKPYVRVRLGNHKVKILLLDSADFKQLKKYHYHDLLKSEEKVRIKVLVKDIEYPLFLMNDTQPAFNGIKVLSVNKIKGKTYGKK